MGEEAWFRYSAHEQTAAVYDELQAIDGGHSAEQGKRSDRPDEIVTTGTITVRLRLTGQMGAWTVSNENVLPTGRKTRALLAVIALSGPRPASRARLAELLWSRRAEDQARASLRQEIQLLLKALAPAGTEILHVTRDQLSLVQHAVWIDVDEITGSSAYRPAALSLLDGDLLEDLDGIDPAFDMWLTGERERLRDRARTMAETLLREQTGSATVIAAAQRLLQIDRAHEEAWRALMRAHADQGERGMAIQAYDRCRAVLAELLDATPSRETQDLLIEIRGPSSKRLPQRPPRPEPPRIPAEVDAAVPARDEAPRSCGVRVGVLPMRTVGLPDELAYLGLGLANEITSALCRFRWLSVISLNAPVGSSAVRTQGGARPNVVPPTAVPPTAVHPTALHPTALHPTALRPTALRPTALRPTVVAPAVSRPSGGNTEWPASDHVVDLDFLLDGAVQRSRNKLRITLRLLDLRAENQVIWARRFDRPTDDMLSVQEDIASEVAAQIDPVMMLIKARRSTASPDATATAQDLILRSALLITRLEQQGFRQAGEHLSRAIALEPDHASAHAWYAAWNVLLLSQGWAADPRQAEANASLLAERAITLDPHSAACFAVAGHVRTFVNRTPLEAVGLYDHALKFNPNLAAAWALSAITQVVSGDTKDAERRYGRYKLLSPLDPYSFLFDALFGVVHILKGDYATAMAVGRAVTQLNPAYTAGHKLYLAALGHLGREEAGDELRRLRALEPNVTAESCLRTLPLFRQADRDHFSAGLKLGGMR